MNLKLLSAAALAASLSAVSANVETPVAAAEAAATTASTPTTAAPASAATKFKSLVFSKKGAALAVTTATVAAVAYFKDTIAALLPDSIQSKLLSSSAPLAAAETTPHDDTDATATDTTAEDSTAN
jgi:hypothetical protein